jgi:hypothetical protein
MLLNNKSKQRIKGLATSVAQHTSLAMQQIDRCDAENSLEDKARQQDNFLRIANSFHVRGDDK